MAAPAMKISSTAAFPEPPAFSLGSQLLTLGDDLAQTWGFHTP
jgi:hypothetical protein